MAFITVGNMYLPEVVTSIQKPAVEWPAPTSEEGLQYWLDQMDMAPRATIAKLVQLEKKDVAWVYDLFELLCKECL